MRCDIKKIENICIYLHVKQFIKNNFNVIKFVVNLTNQNIVKQLRIVR